MSCSSEGFSQNLFQSSVLTRFWSWLHRQPFHSSSCTYVPSLKCRLKLIMRQEYEPENGALKYCTFSVYLCTSDLFLKYIPGSPYSEVRFLARCHAGSWEELVRILVCTCRFAYLKLEQARERSTHGTTQAHDWRDASSSSIQQRGRLLVFPQTH